MGDTAAGGACILVVDDEDAIREMAMEILSDAGFRALGAASAEDALRVLSTGRNVTIVFTDVVMPGGMDGLTFATKVREEWQAIDVVVTSGYAPVSATDLPDRSRFLPKPYRAAALLKVLRQFVDRV
jgi:DNA-binding NtrC family response regulator